MEIKLDQPNEPVQAQDHAACSLDASYVLTWDEIANLAAEPGKPAETLMNVVALIARRFGTDVCSAYLLEPDRANLVLAATIGLRPDCVGKLRMAVNEGLAGLVAEQVRPVAVEHVRNHPRFKYLVKPAKMIITRSWESPSLIAVCCRAFWWFKPWSRVSFRRQRFACSPRPRPGLRL
jgi:putative methionine-R-sulfoxide reductase with GAF domain